MEHIKEALGSFRSPISSQKNIEPEADEPTMEERRERLRKSLGVASLDNTFEKFESASGTEMALAAFRALAEGTTDRPLLLCYGGVGNGKTHLCEATAIALYKRGIFCRVMTMAGMMRVLKNSMHKDEALISYDELLGNYCYARHLIIDDVGMGGSGSEWEYGQLEEIITMRYRERLFTILTTNRELDELPKRVVSRFRDPDIGTVVLNEGADYRRRK